MPHIRFGSISAYPWMITFRAHHLSPRNIRRQIACLLTQSSGCLTNHFNVALDERLQILVSKKSRSLER
jgi:hypothetical protein